MIERERNPWIGLAAGAAVSLLTHAGVAWWLVGSADAGEPLGAHNANPHQPPADPLPLELGQIDTNQAAIAWLGVETDPTEGHAPESEVDQAALSPLPGVESLPTPPAVPEQAEAQTEPPPETSPTIEPEPEIEPQPEPEPAVEPFFEPEPEPPVEPVPTEPAVTDAPPPGPSLVAEPNPVEPPVQEQAEQRPSETEPTEPTEPTKPDATEAAPSPAEIVGPPAPPSDRFPTQASAQTEPPKTATPPTAPGEPAELSERQVDAARKQAIDYDTDTNRPLAAPGLEINTVRPAWPVLVRQSFRPRDPVVLIRFGSDGKVKRVDFLRETNGAKGTGIRAVDGPIIDAVYRWTAKGSRIDALDKNNPTDEIVVPIRILLGAGRIP